MLTIIQDYRDWKMARYALRHIEDSVRKYEISLTQICDKNTWDKNLKNEQLFYEVVPIPQNFDDLFNMVLCVHSNIEILNNAAQKYHATSCFYKYDRETRQCINFSSNDSLSSDLRCETCSQFMFLKYFQKLNYDLTRKEQEYKNAKQKLLDNFRFWKQKS